MADPVARRTDPCTCGAHSKPSTPLISPRPTVTVNGLAPALQYDGRMCGEGQPDRVIMGSATVTFQGRPVVPVGRAVTIQQSSFSAGSTNVRIGGPLVAGDVRGWTSICEAMKTSRAAGYQDFHEVYHSGDGAEHTGSRKYPRAPKETQSLVSNCGCEVVRQLIWGGGIDQPSEEELTGWAKKRGHTNANRNDRTGQTTFNPDDPNSWIYEGGTKSGARDSIATEWSQKRNARPPKMTHHPGGSSQAMVEALKNGNPVVLPVEVPGGKHVVLATGVELDPSGKPVAVFINDSGSAGGCGRRIPLQPRGDGFVLDGMPWDNSDSITVVEFQ